MVLLMMNLLQWKDLNARYDRPLHLVFSLTTTIVKFQSLHSHTGVVFFVIVTCASINDIIQPSWLRSDGAFVSFADSLRTNMWDMLRQFEQSCYARKFGKPFFNPGME